MPAKPAGCQWLKEHYNLSRYILTHSSYIGNKQSIELTSKGNVEQVFGLKYAPATDAPLSHVEFALKYDDISLDFLKAVFERVPHPEIKSFVEKSPASKYARRIGFLYEFLTRNSLELSQPITANYTNLLEDDRYITGTAIKTTNGRLTITC